MSAVPSAGSLESGAPTASGTASTALLISVLSLIITLGLGIFNYLEARRSRFISSQQMRLNARNLSLAQKNLRAAERKDQAMRTQTSMECSGELESLYDFLIGTAPTMEERSARIECGDRLHGVMSKIAFLYPDLSQEDRVCARIMNEAFRQLEGLVSVRREFYGKKQDNYPKLDRVNNVYNEEGKFYDAVLATQSLLVRYESTHNNPSMDSIVKPWMEALSATQDAYVRVVKSHAVPVTLRKVQSFDDSERE